MKTQRALRGLPRVAAVPVAASPPRRLSPSAACTPHPSYTHPSTGGPHAFFEQVDVSVSVPTQILGGRVMR
eukprot:scaffold160347_cov27-Tisochrysis_lutea.AAC.1